MTANWISAAEALSLFSQKYSDPDHARAIFGFCLSEGIIRSRGVILSQSLNDGRGPDPMLALAEDGNINPEIWDFTDLDNDRAWRKSEFVFECEWPKFKFHFDDVEIERTGITKLHGRKGIGGAVFKKYEWMLITHSLVELSKSGGDSDCNSGEDLAVLVAADLNGALSYEYILPDIREIWSQHYAGRG